MKKLILLATLTLIVSNQIHAKGEYLVKKATVTAIGNTIGGRNFFIRTKGGTGPCATAEAILFYEEDAASESVTQRSYAAALTAFNTPDAFWSDL